MTNFLNSRSTSPKSKKDKIENTIDQLMIKKLEINTKKVNSNKKN